MKSLQHKERISYNLVLARTMARQGRLWVLAATILSFACHQEKPPTAATTASPPTSKVHVRAFTEASPVRALAVTSKFAFIATSAGLERWELETGELLLLSSEHGLPGSEIFALAYDEKRDWLWIATDGGITSYELSTSSFRELPPPPKPLDVGSLAGSVLAPALDGGVWIGAKTGLFYAQSGSKGEAGKWINSGVTTQINSLLQLTDGTLWIGTNEQLLFVKDFGDAVPLGAEDGCELSEVIGIHEHNPGIVAVIAKSKSGMERIALVSEDSCAMYGSEEEIHWLGSIRSGGATHLLADDGLYRLGTGKKGTSNAGDSEALTSSMASSGKGDVTIFQLQTKSEEGSAVGTLQLERIKRFDNHPIQIAMYGAHFVVSTKTIGTMHWQAGSEQVEWFRRSEIVSGAKQMTVACESKDSCYVSLGTHDVWHWQGEQFVLQRSSSRVHSILRLRDGRIVGIRDTAMGEDERGLVVSVLSDGQWSDVLGIRIETPGEGAHASSLHESPDGTIWFALGYLEEETHVGFGIAAIDLNLNLVWYHRASFDEKVTQQGILPVPVDVTGIAFIGEDRLWLASTQGATRVQGTNVKNYNERDGLLSDLLRALVSTPGGMVFTASSQGVGVWDGEKWTAPPALRTSVQDLALGLDGRLWLATSRGIGVYDGEKARRLDTRRGLLENEILELESDYLGRIWARSEQGLVIVSP